MSVPNHHKELAIHLRELFGEPIKISEYLDKANRNSIAIGEFGPSSKPFYSTLGVCDRTLKIPNGTYEFASMGKMDWLPNVLASSIYWLRDRNVETWPILCEDVVKHNARSTYRHMVYISSQYSVELSTNQTVKWLLGVPVKDSEILIDIDRATCKAAAIYPKWLFSPDD